MDYNLGIWIVLGILLLIAIISTIINHNKKTKSNPIPCPACRNMGFNMIYTSRPIPSCKKCDGTGYVDKNKNISL